MREKQQIFHYSGYEMRSHSETRWAGMMSAIDICWHYEPKVVETRHGAYLPDFYLPAVGVFLEVKGAFPNQTEIEKAADAEASTGRPVIFAYGKTEMQGACLVGGAITYFRGERKVSFSSYELSEIVRRNYDMHTYAAFISAGEHQPRPDFFSVGDLLDESFTRMMDRGDHERYLANKHAPLNKAKDRLSSEPSKAEQLLSSLIARFHEKLAGYEQ